MPEPVEGKMRFENGKWQVFFDGAWITLTDAEQQQYLKDLLQESGLGGTSKLNIIPPASTTGTPSGTPTPPGPPAGPRGEAWPRPPAEVYPQSAPWPIKKRQKVFTEAGAELVGAEKEVDDVDKMYAWSQRAIRAGYVLNQDRTAWMKKEEEQEEPPPTREDIESFLLQEGLWDKYEAVPDPKTGGWTFREKKVAPPAKAPTPVAEEPRAWTDPATGVRYVETSPGRWDEQTRPPVTRESVATSIEQLIAQALLAEKWDLAIAYRDFRDAPTDAEKAQTAFDMALRFSESTVDFDTLKTAFDFFMGPGASQSLGISAGQPPAVFGPSGRPLTPEQLTMGQTPVPLLPPGVPGGPQFPGFGAPGGPVRTTMPGAPAFPGGGGPEEPFRATMPGAPQFPGGGEIGGPFRAPMGGAFGQPRNVEADLQKELDALGQKAQASQEGTGPDLTPEEADRLRSLPQLLAASKAGPPQFPAEFASQAEMERSRQEAQAAQDRGVIDAFAPYNFPDVQVGAKAFPLNSNTARYWLSLSPQEQQTMLQSGFAPNEQFIVPNLRQLETPEDIAAELQRKGFRSFYNPNEPLATLERDYIRLENEKRAKGPPPVTDFARNPTYYWGEPVPSYQQQTGGANIGATVRFNTPEEQLALAKANQQFAAQGVYGQGGYDVSGAPSAWEEFQRFKGATAGQREADERRLEELRQLRANQPEGSVAGQVGEEEKGILAKQIPDFATFQKAKPAGYKFTPEKKFQPNALDRLRMFPRPAKKQFSPRTRIFA